MIQLFKKRKITYNLSAYIRREKMHRNYLKINKIKDYNFETVKNAIGLFDNQKEYFEVLKEKEFIAYNIELADVLRNNKLLEFLKSKYVGISNEELVRLTEMLFVSDINELNRLDKDEMLNIRKGIDFVMNEIWIPFIEEIGSKTKLFFYTWDCSNIKEVIKYNNLNHIIKPINEQLFLVEYINTWLDEVNDDFPKVKLIDLILFDKYILGFNKDNSNYNFSKESIEDYKNNEVEVLCYINHELGNSILLVNKDILI